MEHGKIPSSPKTDRVTPLVIMLFFVILVQSVAIYGIVNTNGVPQIILILFVVLFPVYISYTFFALLSNKPWIFYGPRDYGNDIDPRLFIETLKVSLEVSDARGDFISNFPTIIDKAVKHSAVKHLPISDLAQSISNNIKMSELISIDISNFGGSVVTLPYEENFRVNSLLDFLYYEIKKSYDLPPTSYSKMWILKNKTTDLTLAEMGRIWARKRGRRKDDRPIGDVGISAGDELVAQKLEMKC